MAGPVRSRRALIAAIAWVLTTPACRDGGADYLLLDRFFAASRLRDRTALARFATVVFEPHVDGIVVRFDVVGSGPLSADDLPDAVREQVARLSLDDPIAMMGSPRTSDTVVVSREVTIRATVRAPNGSAADRTLRVQVRRAEAVPGRVGRWVVTDVR
jgi:hypothetical protein